MTDYFCSRAGPPTRATIAFTGFDPAVLLSDAHVEEFKSENPGVKGQYIAIDVYERTSAKQYISGKLENIRKTSDE